jgi:3-methyladenine DNA glycosylase AlkD
VTDADEILAALHAARAPQEVEKIAPRIQGSDMSAIGVRMGIVFDIAKSHASASLQTVDALLQTSEYEARMVAVSILDFRARDRKLTDDDRRALYELWMSHLERMTTWDLIDRSAPRVVGGYLADKPRDVLFDLARSEDRWRRRTAITATFWFIRAGDLDDALALCDVLADDPEHLVHTSVGVALREVGRVDPQRLEEFLAAHGYRLGAHARRTARSAL